MINFRQIVQMFETIADKHIMIKSFHTGMLDEVDINKINTKDYVILYLEPQGVIIDTGVMTYSFTIYTLDIINNNINTEPVLGDATLETFKERKGRLDAYTDNLLILKDVINEFKQNGTDESWAQMPQNKTWLPVFLETPINAEPFSARFDNLLTGWSATLSIQVDNENNLCDVPVEAND
tara:strand:+ start:1289 stop:1828 length:540 start_codon:yes stop_codon:yes gene_type:complete